MTQIEYLTKSWPLVTGCTPAGPGCLNCFAARNAATRLKHRPQYAGLARYEDGRGIWTGEVRVHEDLLDRPLCWRKPQVVGVAFSGDLFHYSVPADFILRAWDVMAEASNHVFIVLTKRIERALVFLAGYGNPLPNIVLMTSAEDQARLDQRVPVLLQCPAAVRGVSLEPMLGEVDLSRQPRPVGYRGQMIIDYSYLAYLDWVVCGAESGHRARPLHPDGPRAVRDQCDAARVPFWFKQHGEWLHESQLGGRFSLADIEEKPMFYWPDGSASYRIGKKAAGNLLDGERWEQAPALIEQISGGKA